VILSAAAQRADGNVLPLPGSLRGGAATKVVAALLSRGLIREQITDSLRKADTAMNTIWRNKPDGRGVLLIVTPAGLEAIGVETEAGPETETVAKEEPATRTATVAGTAPVEPAPTRRGRPRTAAPTGADTAPAPKTRDGTKQARVIAMLRRREGATIDQIVEATAWRPHTVRGFFAGALKRKLGLEVTSEKVDGGERVYRITGEAGH
jgi:DNA-binding MarR family transcriptional regulator